jgi:hypothetical protein
MQPLKQQLGSLLPRKELAQRQFRLIFQFSAYPSTSYR